MTTRPATSLDPSRAATPPGRSPRRRLDSGPSPTLGISRRPTTSPSPPATRPAAPPHGAMNLPDGFSLRDLLVCDGCDQPLRPTITPAGGRGYRSGCGCGPGTVDAATVERLVRDVVDRHSAALVADAPPAALGEVFRALFATVRIGGNGGNGEELSPVWRF